jgi:hypothetical protein
MGRTLSKKDLQTLEECAFYESGLCADGCLEKLDPYTREAIERYGRYLLKERGKLELEYFKKLKKSARSLYGTVLHVYALAKENAIILVGPELYKEAAKNIKEYEELEWKN